MMTNRITRHFKQCPEGTLSVFFTAGHPGPDDTLEIMAGLQEGGAHMIEIGMPFSDPTADGPTIQESNKVALENGMTLQRLFDQLTGFRNHIHLPVLLMGYINPVLQFGVDAFLDACAECGVDGLILPDLPAREYDLYFREGFERRNLSNIFLATPQTSAARIREIDSLSRGFIYFVSTYATTGGQLDIDSSREQYFISIRNMQLENPALLGFGIHDRSTFINACRYAHGAIIGSAFIKALHGSRDVQHTAREFCEQILHESSYR